MKLGHLIEYSMRNIFLHTKNVVEKLVQDPLIKNKNGASLDQQSEML